MKMKSCIASASVTIFAVFVVLLLSGCDRPNREKTNSAGKDDIKAQKAILALVSFVHRLHAFRADV